MSDAKWCLMRGWHEPMIWPFRTQEDAEVADLQEVASRFRHRMICWECGGSGVMAKDKRAVPCEVCRDEYGRIEVVPRSDAGAETQAKGASR